jgi:integrase
VQAWLSQWLEAERGAVAGSTYAKYRGITEGFLRFLGTRAHTSLESLSTDDFLRHRDQLLAEGRAPRTVNQSIRRVLSRPFVSAVQQGILKRNPVAGVRPLRDVTVEKGVFTPEQIRALIAVAEGDWTGLILMAYCTGGRQGDLVRLTWGAINFDERSITFSQTKTGAKIKIPIHPELEDYLLFRSVPDDGRKPLFPTLCHLESHGSKGLSKTFAHLLESAGIEAGVARVKIGAAGKTVHRLSFHSLRHSFTSALANAGVSAELRQKLTGHADAKSHGTYTHLEFETIREALGALGRLPSSEGRQ